jgi:hypothetical protein
VSSSANEVAIKTKRRKQMYIGPRLTTKNCPQKKPPMLSPLDRTPSPHDHVWRPPSTTEMQQSTTEILGTTIREDLPEEVFVQHEEEQSIDCDIFNVHFQLRKTVVCVGNTTYFTTVNGVHSYNYLTHKVCPSFLNILTPKLSSLLKLDRPITSLAATRQYLVVGGAVGTLLVYDLLSSSIIWDSPIKGSFYLWSLFTTQRKHAERVRFSLHF